MKTNSKRLNLIFGLLISSIIAGACKKDAAELATIVDDDATTPRAVYANRSLNWNGRADATYTLAQAQTDFGNIISGWNESRVHIRSQRCRITLLKDKLSAAGGMIAYVDITNGSEYEVQFDANFHSDFTFRKGGKMGWGFFIGDGASGGSDARDGKGGSLRLVWHQADDGTKKFGAYAYHKDQADEYGTVYGEYPASGSLSVSTWYTVKLYFKANTGSSTNGRLKMTVNGTVVKDIPMRWTTDDTKRTANRLCFETFRGGSSADFISGTTDYIYFDNLTWTRISS